MGDTVRHSLNLYQFYLAKCLNEYYIIYNYLLNLSCHVIQVMWYTTLFLLKKGNEIKIIKKSGSFFYPLLFMQIDWLRTTPTWHPPNNFFFINRLVKDGGIYVNFPAGFTEIGQSMLVVFCLPTPVQGFSVDLTHVVSHHYPHLTPLLRTHELLGDMLNNFCDTYRITHVERWRLLFDSKWNIPQIQVSPQGTSYSTAYLMFG